jgi:hypothetical protein
MQPTFTLAEGILLLEKRKSEELKLIDRCLYVRAKAFHDIETNNHNVKDARGAWKLMDETERKQYRKKFEIYAVQKKTKFVKEGGEYGFHSLRSVQETYKMMGDSSSLIYEEVLKSAIEGGVVNAITKLIKEKCVSRPSKNEAKTLFDNWFRLWRGASEEELKTRGDSTELLSLMCDYPDLQLISAREIGRASGLYHQVAEVLPEPNKTKFLCSHLFVEHQSFCLEQKMGAERRKIDLPPEIKAMISMLVSLGRVEEADKIIDEHFDELKKEIPPSVNPKTTGSESKPKKPMSLKELIESDTVILKKEE